MTNEELEKFKNELKNAKQKINAHLEHMKAVPEFSGDTASPDEESDESEEFGNQLALVQEYRKHLADIESALQKIENKNYGACEKCGQKISIDVLEAMPESRLCKDCKRGEHKKQFYPESR